MGAMKHVLGLFGTARPVESTVNLQIPYRRLEYIHHLQPTCLALVRVHMLSKDYGCPPFASTGSSSHSSRLVVSLALPIGDNWQVHVGSVRRQSRRLACQRSVPAAAHGQSVDV